MIVTGLVRELAGGGLPRVVPGAGTVGIGSHSGLIAIGAVYIMAKAFANGGSSLTGIEAVSNAVSALRPPEGRHARQILATQGTLVAVLIAGISWLAHVTHAIPYTSGFPTVLAQEARVVFGNTAAGQVLFFAVQAATAAILFTGGNTSFTGFPFLASFVAEDSFLPRWLGKRGHRLAFSNGILLLAGLSVALMLVAGATVDALIPFYAIGVFTGFAMAGFGMARYHRRTREPGWRRKLAINLAGGIYTALVVLLFAVVKFTEGAWLIVIVFPVLVFLLIRLNREYRAEAACLADTADGAPRAQPPNYSRRVVLLLVDDYDLATIAALKYARSLRPTVLRAVHFSLDSARADQLRRRWVDARTGIPLELADCPDRRLAHAAARLAASLAAAPGTHVTVVLPRRSYPPLAGRLLHDHTADRIARDVSRVPDATATIVPFDVAHRVEATQAKRSRTAAAPRPGRLEDYEWPEPPPGTDLIGSLRQPGQATVQGRLHTARDPVQPAGRHQRAGLRDRRLQRGAHGAVPRPHPHRRRRAGNPHPTARRGRHRRRRPPGDDQPRLRPADLATWRDRLPQQITSAFPRRDQRPCDTRRGRRGMGVKSLTRLAIDGRIRRQNDWRMPWTCTAGACWLSPTSARRSSATSLPLPATSGARNASASATTSIGWRDGTSR